MTKETRIKQVGGSHYQGYPYPLDRLYSDIAIGYWHGVYIKYLFRYRHKNGLEDLYKALSVLPAAREEYGARYAAFEQLMDFISPLLTLNRFDNPYLADRAQALTQQATHAFSPRCRAMIRKFLKDNEAKFAPEQRNALEKGLLALFTDAEQALCDLILKVEQTEREKVPVSPPQSNG